MSDAITIGEVLLTLLIMGGVLGTMAPVAFLVIWAIFIAPED